LYKQALISAAAGSDHTSLVHSLHPRSLNAAFSASYKQAEQKWPCFGAHAMSGEEWWLHVVRGTLQRAGIPPEALAELLPPAFDSLYHRVFVSRCGWSLAPGTEEVLRTLSEWRRNQPEESRTALGVISNWDDVSPHAEVGNLLPPSQVGAEKPELAIFEEARRAVGMAEGARAIHCALLPLFRDVCGAVAANWEAVFLTSEEKMAEAPSALLEQMHEVPHARIYSLSELPAILGLKLSSK
ncbi:MAG: hypothetical protein SGPRY_014697, partial [Prymnesium sp.]